MYYRKRGILMLPRPRYSQELPRGGPIVTPTGGRLYQVLAISCGSCTMYSIDPRPRSCNGIISCENLLILNTNASYIRDRLRMFKRNNITSLFNGVLLYLYKMVWRFWFVSFQRVQSHNVTKISNKSAKYPTENSIKL